MSPQPSEECYAFASFRLYPKQRTLLHAGDIVAIGGRAFDVLLLLVARAGVVVSLRDLMSYVWPAVTVEEANLRVQMGMVRKILSQCEQAKRAIETIPLRGYCFILPVRHHPNGIEPTGQALLTNAPLPTLFSPPIGREDTITAIKTALDDRRLITITGPGGIGKTTVAIATANRYAVGFDGMISFIDLSSAADGEGAAAMIADALGIVTRDSAVAGLCEHLRDQNMLLILDTCEHIVGQIAELVETLLTHCSQLRLMVTSREALRATGEWTHRLSSLTFPEEGEEVSEASVTQYSAMELFVDRVGALMRFEIDRKDVPILAEICRRLDGIPLALEFAAARVPDLGLYEIAAHLDDRFTILTRGRRTALPRHRTLSAALDWSFSLLSKEEQLLLRQLATLNGAFTVERAIASGRQIGCAQSPEALASLYEKSILTVDIRDDAPFYRLLDTTRVYVTGLADS